MDEKSKKEPNRWAIKPELYRKIRVDIDDGLSLTKAAKKYGVSASTLSRYIRGINLSKKPIELKPCGTNAAYQRHLSNKEIPCIACMDAHAANHRRQYHGTTRYKKMHTN